MTSAASFTVHGPCLTRLYLLVFFDKVFRVDTPLLTEEEWTRPQEDVAKPPLRSGRRAEPAQARAKRERDSAKHQAIGRSHQEKTSLTLRSEFAPLSDAFYREAVLEARQMSPDE